MGESFVRPYHLGPSRGSSGRMRYPRQACVFSRPPETPFPFMAFEYYYTYTPAFCQWYHTALPRPGPTLHRPRKSGFVSISFATAPRRRCRAITGHRSKRVSLPLFPGFLRVLFMYVQKHASVFSPKNYDAGLHRRPPCHVDLLAVLGDVIGRLELPFHRRPAGERACGSEGVYTQKNETDIAHANVQSSRGQTDKCRPGPEPPSAGRAVPHAQAAGRPSKTAPHFHRLCLLPRYWLLLPCCAAE